MVRAPTDDAAAVVLEPAAVVLEPARPPMPLVSFSLLPADAIDEIDQCAKTLPKASQDADAAAGGHMKAVISGRRCRCGLSCSFSGRTRSGDTRALAVRAPALLAA